MTTDNMLNLSLKFYANLERYCGVCKNSIKCKYSYENDGSGAPACSQAVWAATIIDELKKKGK